MRIRTLVSCLAAALVSQAASAQPPVILSLQTNRALTWTGGISNSVGIIYKSPNLHPGTWLPFAYDFSVYAPSSILPYPYVTNVPISSPRTTVMPPSTNSSAYFRIGLQTNVPDPSLLMHLSFDNDFPSAGAVMDISGHGNHGMRYGYPANPESNRFPMKVVGPDGSQAAEFHWYADGWGDYLHSGDYIGIPTTSDFTNLSTMTISYWCHYYGFINGGCDCNSTPLQAGMSATGAWTIGRYYDTFTSFGCEYLPNVGTTALEFPDNAPNGDTGGWHHYAVTFDHGNVVGYFDGTNFSPFGSAIVPNQVLTVAGVYLGIGVWTFNVDPWLNGDGHPNNAWMNGALDDIRIYDRALSASEIFNLYTNFDKQTPTAPQNLRVRTDSSTQTELTWDASTDNFRVVGYHVIRNGVTVADSSGTHYIDTGLTPLTAYTYKVQAFDPANNTSPFSNTVMTNTPANGSSVEVIVDNDDGPQWVTIVGNWTAYSSIFPNFYASSFLNGFAPGAVSVTFRPTLPEAGNYDVYVWNPGAPGNSYDLNVPVDIVHGGVTNTISMNQSINYGIWNFLGTYSFTAGTTNFLRYRTTGTSGAVAADAVRFVK